MQNPEVNPEVSKVTPPLGLGNPPAPVRLFVEHIVATGEQPACGWLRYEGKTKMPVAARGLFGFLVDVRYHKGEYQGKVNLNLRFTFKADKLYIVQSGAKTAFCTGLLQCLEAVPNVRAPLCLEIDPPEANDKVVFANVHVGTLMGEEWTYEKVRPANYDAERPLSPIVRAMQEKLGTPVQAEEELYELLGRTPPASARQQAPSPQQQPRPVSVAPPAKPSAEPVGAVEPPRALRRFDTPIGASPDSVERVGLAGSRVLEAAAAAAAQNTVRPHEEITAKTLEEMSDDDIPF